MSGGRETEGTVTGLYYYPVKSLAGIRLEQAELAGRGIRHDRMWMLVSDSGKFITQRQEHSLALLRVTAEDDGFRISAPSGAETRLPRACPPGPTKSVRVWKDELTAIVGPPDATSFFSEYLGFPCSAVRMPEKADRTAGKHAPDGTPVSFADAYPGLLTTSDSLADLNARTNVDLVMRRFRPSIVVSGSPAYAEDGWSRIRLGDAEITCVKPCARCVLTTVDPDSGAAGKEPLRTLAGYRRLGNDVYFGQNFVVSRAGAVSLGDPIAITERKEPVFPAG
jgi:hypothetical protein